ncbi:hypothetical protein QAD02_022305 [Eretmocerus hayati]|uniref:Uncharacterized protein n=1 Tax=Eretmocerus hayati TaxID=131215 RepID=A0ACC2PSL1_9HYME|nr:hypothetical protein QAD02_022305 [Eretmocerus hayati]
MSSSGLLTIISSTSTTTRLIARFVVFATVLLLVHPVQASGVFELRLKSFANENGKDSLGRCCSGGQALANGECPGLCRTRFRVCLKQYQANIDTTTPCTYGDVVTPVLGDNVLNLTASGATFANPIRFPFDFTWPGTFSLIVEAFHDNTENATHGSVSGGNAPERVIITRLATQRWLDVGPEWIEDEHRSHHSMMVYEYRVTCSAHYYGKGCENLCRPRDDNFGHYRCSPTGERVCLSGWKGDYCATPHCLAGCDEQHGHCSRPNECTCHNGWTGQFCDQCVRYPGCLHGSCQKPWECLCDEGWGGLFCNQDLNFCTNHKPCRNGGTCFNTGQGSYTCSCAPGFTGTDCETPLTDCTSQPCLNGGSCQPQQNATLGHDGVARRYKCSCPAGWRGRHCEVSSRSCRDSPCARGATCEDDSERGYTCHCPAGFAGPDCDLQIDECAPNPCANGGTCTDLVAGFRCACPPGFNGTRCQINVDDCAEQPCLNGGSCVDLPNRFRCQCVPGYAGRLCQDKVDYCVAKPCANGGSCTSTTNDWACVCKPGFAGKDCSVDVDECKSSPCQHGGTCRNRVNGFVCECTDNWRGDTCSEPPARAGYWQSTPGGGSGSSQTAAVAAAPEASRHEALSTEHMVVIATISTAVPAFVLVAVLAVLCMKRRQKREQAKADEEARLQNERNAVHSSMTKRASALRVCDSSGLPLGGGMIGGGGPGSANGDSHMIKNTWTAAIASSSSLLLHGLGAGVGMQMGGNGSGSMSCNGKSVNNVTDNDGGSSLLLDGYKPEPVLQEPGRPRNQKQLNTEAAAHRAASQQLYCNANGVGKQDKEAGCTGLSLASSSCHQLLQDGCSPGKRASSLFSATTDSSCCSGGEKRPNCSESPPPPDECGAQLLQPSDTTTCSATAVFVIDATDHYTPRRHDLATEV